jgi:hypothetical protein
VPRTGEGILTLTLNLHWWAQYALQYISPIRAINEKLEMSITWPLNPLCPLVNPRTLSLIRICPTRSATAKFSCVQPKFAYAAARDCRAQPQRVFCNIISSSFPSKLKLFAVPNPLVTEQRWPISKMLLAARNWRRRRHRRHRHRHRHLHHCRRPQGLWISSEIVTSVLSSHFSRS